MSDALQAEGARDMMDAAAPAPMHDPRPMEVADYPDVLPVVRQTERLEMLVPRAIMTIFIGLPILLGLAHGHPILGLINAVLLCFVGAFLCRVVAILVLAPLHALRYGRVVRDLTKTLDALVPTATCKAHWMAGSPGALAITPLGTVLLVDRSTDFRFVSLADAEIIAVDRHVEQKMRMTTRSRPGFMLGLPTGRALFGGWTFGGRTVTHAEMTATHSIMLRYQREDDHAIRCAVVPFGPNEIGAENLRLALERLRCSALG